jgi:hypothetical protein
MFHTIYKTTNLMSGKFYIGYHKTENPDDTYLGSGKYLRNAIAKYGTTSFKKEILFVFPDATPAFLKEEELVRMSRSNPLCMNIRKGGSGGWDWVNGNASNRLDLKGKTFGHLTVIESCPSKTPYQTRWLTRCTCGKQKEVSTNALRMEKTISCGCVRREDLTGRKFGYLTVTGLASGSVWVCQCECGKKKHLKAQRLKSGDVKSCGCLHPKRPKIVKGQVFGRLTVLSRGQNSKTKRSRWLVQCSCGEQKEVLGASLLCGATQSCGCLRREVTAQLRKGVGI